MAELESLVANSVYLRARNADPTSDSRFGRSKKWRQLLIFPHVRDCADLELFLRDSGELELFQILRQPIGKREFELACAGVPLWATMLDFIAHASTFEEAVTDAQRLDQARLMCRRFFVSSCPLMQPPPQLPNPQQPSSARSLVDGEAAGPGADSGAGRSATRRRRTVLPVALVHEVEAAVEDGHAPHDLFSKCAGFINSYLADRPLSYFFDTDYFSRFLQWKMLEQRPLSHKRFRIYRVLGRGGFGEVYAVQCRETGKMYALKRMNRKRVKEKKAQELAMNERNLLEKIDSRFVVSLTHAYVTKTDLCLITTLMNSGDLHFHIHNGKRFPEDRARFYAAQICLGLQDMHTLRVVYRDLKPENVLLDGEGNIRISDLGLSLELPEGKAVRGRVGTPGYMAPEIIAGHKYGFAVDVFGLGCVIFEMIEGHGPFRNARGKHKIQQQDMADRVLGHEPEFRVRTSPEAVSICRALLAKEPSERLGCRGGVAAVPDWEAVKRHPFFNGIDWPKLRSGEIKPPFVPDASTIYAKDIMDISPLQAAKNIKITEEDDRMFEAFAGTNPRSFQADLLETVFDDLNPIEPRTPDLDRDYKEPVRTLRNKLNPFNKKPPKRPTFDVESAGHRRRYSTHRSSVIQHVNTFQMHAHGDASHDDDNEDDDRSDDADSSVEEDRHQPAATAAQVGPARYDEPGSTALAAAAGARFSPVQPRRGSPLAGARVASPLLLEPDRQITVDDTNSRPQSPLVPRAASPAHSSSGLRVPPPLVTKSSMEEEDEARQARVAELARAAATAGAGAVPGDEQVDEDPEFAEACRASAFSPLVEDLEGTDSVGELPSFVPASAGKGPTVILTRNSNGSLGSTEA